LQTTEPPIDLVLLDVMMPGMSGFEVCRKIRETHPIDKLPVLFLSATDQLNERVAGLQEGGNDYLTKPIARSELLSRVFTHLSLLEAHRLQEEEVDTLRGLLPVCLRCKKIHEVEDEAVWVRLETYLGEHPERGFKDGICPSCQEDTPPSPGSRPG
jgi:DNA-binding response OmpR family regulator